jgi:dipeptidyl aminopeptidase/acylaminoacyl peptidase
MINIKIKVIFFVLFLPALYAQNNVLTSYNLFDIKSVTDTEVSPDGKYAAYIVNVPRPFTDKPGIDYKHLFLLNVETGSTRALLEEKESVSFLRWSRDSKSIGFLAKLGEEKFAQVYLINTEGGSLKKLTSAACSVKEFEFSPDGSQIAYVSSEPELFRKKKLIEKGFDAEIYEEEIRDLNLYVQELKNNQSKKLTSNFTVYDFEWSPDGSQILAVTADKNLVDYSYMFKRIYLIDPANGVRTLLVENPGKLDAVAWAPDGKHIAFISAVDINDPVSGSLFIAEVPNNKKFTELKNYSEDFAGAVTHIAWKDEGTILFSADEGVYTTLSEQDINLPERNIIIEPGKVVFTSFSFENDIVSFAGNTPSHPAELFTFELNENQLTKHTELNPWLENINLAKQEKIEYEARDGLRIEGVLLYPLNFSEDKKYPLIVYAHGGPESCVKNGWSTNYNMWGQVAAAKDYFVFMPNYRASSGRGDEFSKMDFGDLADEEFNDVIDGVDYLINKGWVDKNKVGIGGGSYGGYFAGWGATKHTSRFAAAVSFVGVSNQISKRNTTDIPYEDYYVHWGIWTHEDYELVYDRSPVKYAHQSKTPTLILHGKEDPRVHPSQSLELYRALKLHSKAPVRLVWYPGQKHGNTKNTSKLDYNLRTMEWFDYYLKSNKPKEKMPDKYLDIDNENLTIVD